ncbi:hypothetical protein CPB86DRAFT_149243 [Serendipita vermifera]|nr:hypothetical protein CPB86DRAFT_149243 [Serendipita vermifera]
MLLGTRFGLSPTKSPFASDTGQQHHKSNHLPRMSHLLDCPTLADLNRVKRSTDARVVYSDCGGWTLTGLAPSTGLSTILHWKTNESGSCYRGRTSKTGILQLVQEELSKGSRDGINPYNGDQSVYTYHQELRGRKDMRVGNGKWDEKNLSGLCCEGTGVSPTTPNGIKDWPQKQPERRFIAHEILHGIG